MRLIHAECFERFPVQPFEALVRRVVSPQGGGKRQCPVVVQARYFVTKHVLLLAPRWVVDVEADFWFGCFQS